MTSWSFLTNHARVLLCVAHDPGARLRDIAASLDITERSALGIITDLVEAGYVIKEKDGRRNRYHIQAHLLLPEPTAGNAPSVTCWPCWSARAGQGDAGSRMAISSSPDMNRNRRRARPGHFAGLHLVVHRGSHRHVGYRGAGRVHAGDDLRPVGCRGVS